MAKDFALWLAEVDKIVTDEIGVSLPDLPNYPYLDDFEAGCQPEYTAGATIANAHGIEMRGWEVEAEGPARDFMF